MTRDQIPGPSADKKRGLRAQYRQIRDELPEPTRLEASAAIALQVLQMEPIQSCRVLFSYVSSWTEVDTRDLLQTLINDGRQVLVPASETCSTPLGTLYQLPPFSKESVGLPAPVACSNLSIDQIEVFLVPALAWDELGFRIGFGGGYFDRLLDAANPDAVKIGLGFEAQLTPPMVPDVWDIPMDFLVTERRIIDCCRNRQFSLKG